MKRLIKIWLCLLLHKHEIKKFNFPHEYPFEFDFYYKGCAKCDIWKSVNQPQG